MNKEGYARVRLNGNIIRTDEEVTLDRYKKHDIEVVIDRLETTDRSRLAEAVENTLKKSEGLVLVADEEGKESTYSSLLACPVCGLAFEELAIRGARLTDVLLAAIFSRATFPPRKRTMPLFSRISRAWPTLSCPAASTITTASPPAAVGSRAVRIPCSRTSTNSDRAPLPPTFPALNRRTPPCSNNCNSSLWAAKTLPR